MNNLSGLAGWAARTPWRPGAPDWLAGAGLPRAAHGRSRCFGIHMCTAHQKRQRPAPRGLGRPQIGHLELEGKTNHGELWDACLSSVAPAVAAEGRAGGAGTRSMLPSGGATKRPFPGGRYRRPHPLPAQTPLGVPPAASPAPPAPVRRTAVPPPPCTHICPTGRPPAAEPHGVSPAPRGAAVLFLPLGRGGGVPPAGRLSRSPGPATLGQASPLIAPNPFKFTHMPHEAYFIYKRGVG